MIKRTLIHICKNYNKSNYCGLWNVFQLMNLFSICKFATTKTDFKMQLVGSSGCDSEATNF